MKFIKKFNESNPCIATGWHPDMDKRDKNPAYNNIITDNMRISDMNQHGINNKQNRKFILDTLTSYDRIKKLLESGLDPNLENGALLRMAAKNGDIKIIDLLIEKGADISKRLFAVIPWAIEHNQLEATYHLINIIKNDPENLKKLKKDYIKNWIHWAESSDKYNEETKKIIEYLENLLKELF